MQAFAKRTLRGFTLIEVAVALAILGWVLGSCLFIVSQYADERLKMRDRFFSNQVAMNQLLTQYQYSHGWGRNFSLRQQENPFENQAGQEWYWELTVEEAMGENLFRYQVNAGFDETLGSSSSLSLYLTSDGGQL